MTQEEFEILLDKVSDSEIVEYLDKIWRKLNSREKMKKHPHPFVSEMQALKNSIDKENDIVIIRSRYNDLLFAIVMYFKLDKASDFEIAEYLVLKRKAHYSLKLQEHLILNSCKCSSSDIYLDYE